MKHKYTLNLLIAGVVLILLSGCASTLQNGGKSTAATSSVSLLLAPLQNATDDDHAGTALTEITGTVLMQRGVSITRADVSTDAGTPDTATFCEKAREKKLTHVVEGTVHEYRYKTDLDGDPAVGVTLRLVEASSGKVVWQGSSAEVGVGFSSLTSAAQDALQELVGRMPLR